MGALRNPSGNTATVQVMAGEGMPEERTVRLGMRSRIAAEVVSGLEPGEKVISGVAEEDSGGMRIGRPGKAVVRF